MSAYLAYKPTLTNNYRTHGFYPQNFELPKISGHPVIPFYKVVWVPERQSNTETAGMQKK